MLRLIWTTPTAGWLYFWSKEDFITSQILVTINTFSQLYAVSRLPPVTEASPALLRLTHLVAKTSAGIGVLDFVDNGSVALVRASRHIISFVVCSVFLPALSCTTILGSSRSYLWALPNSRSMFFAPLRFDTRIRLGSVVRGTEVWRRSPVNPMGQSSRTYCTGGRRYRGHQISAALRRKGRRARALIYSIAMCDVSFQDPPQRIVSGVNVV